MCPARDRALRTFSYPLAILDTNPRARPARHPFVADEAPWFEMNDGLPRWNSWSREFDLEATDGANIPCVIAGKSVTAATSDQPPQAAAAEPSPTGHSDRRLDAGITARPAT